MIHKTILRTALAIHLGRGLVNPTPPIFCRIWSWVKPLSHTHSALAIDNDYLYKPKRRWLGWRLPIRNPFSCLSVIIYIDGINLHSRPHEGFRNR